MGRDEGMNSCPSFDMLMRFMDGELSPGESALLGTHLENCPDCRRVLESQGMLERSYRESFAAPPEDAFRLMEKRVMASAPRTVRRIPASIQIAAALILTLAGMRLVAGHETELLRVRPAETIVVTAESEAIPGAARDSAQALEEVHPDVPVESMSSVTGQVAELGQEILDYRVSDLVISDEQAQANRGDESGAGGLVGDVTLAMDSGSYGGGGGEAAGDGAVGQALPSVAPGYTGTSGGSIDDMVQTACQEAPECLSISEEGEESDVLGSISAGRTCDADGTSGETEARDLERSRFESFTSGFAQAAVGAAGTLLASSPPASFFLVFNASGEPASPDSVFLDESFPGWKDSLRGHMRDTTLVLSTDGFAELMF